MTTGTLWRTFLEGLTQLDSTFEQALNPPTAPLAEALAAITAPYSAPGGYTELYEQGDGERGDDSAGIFFGLRFLPLAEVQALRTQWAEELLDDEEEALSPQEHHLPIFSDLTGNALCVDLQHGQRVVMVGADYDAPEPLTENLQELLTWAVWRVGRRASLKLERSPGIRAALSLADRTVVPNAIRHWKYGG